MSARRSLVLMCVHTKEEQQVVKLEKVKKVGKGRDEVAGRSGG